jgi:hypothetical protein
MDTGPALALEPLSTILPGNYSTYPTGVAGAKGAYSGATPNEYAHSLALCRCR